MAIEKTINIDVNSKNATKGVEELGKSVEDLNSSLNETEKADVSIEKIGKSSKKSSKAVRLVGKGFKGLGVAIKAAGIGLIISALVGLKEIFSQNQKIVDVFSTAFETFSIVANQVVTAVINVYEAVATSSENFNGLGEVLGSLLKIALTPLKLSFYAIKLALQTAQLAWEESFFGDKDPETIERLKAGIKETGENIKEVAEDAVEAGKNIAENIGDAVSEVANIGKLAGEELGKVSVKAALETAKTNVQLKKSAELAAAQIRGLIEEYDIQAEQQRQIRDEERNSIADRIAANDKLKKTLENQEKQMLRNADVVIAAAQAQFDLTGKDEDYVALLDAKTEKLGVLAQIEGFMSEQKANDLALDREQIELNNAKLESESNLSIQRKRFNAEQIQDETERLEALKKIDLLEAEQETIRLQAIVDNANAGTQAKIDAQIALDEFTEQSRQTNITRDAEIAKADLDLDKKVKDAKIANAEAVSGAIGTLAGIAGEGTAAGKALGVASATIDTYVGANKAIAAFPGPAGIAQAVAIIATGLKNVKTILSTKVPKTNVGGISGGGGGGGGGASTPPSFNIVGASDTNQLADAIGGQTQQPVQAFVVANDVTTAQSLENNIVEGATL